MEIKIDICGLQEVRWRGASARLVEGKDSRYKMFWVGNGKSMSGVGILLAEKWVKAIFGVKRASNRIMLIKLVVGKSIVTVPSVYAPQAGLDVGFKDLFYGNLQWIQTKLGASRSYLFVGISMVTLERIRKICGKSISRPLELLNECVSNGVFPSTWKKGNIVPIHKKNDRQCSENYRPVS